MMEFPIFDTHQHVGALDVGSSGGGGTLSPEEDYTRRIEVMDRFGLRAGAIMPSLQYPRPNGIVDTRAINDLVAGYRDRHRDRFPVALGTVEPLHGEAVAVEEIRRLAEDLHLDGVVWHHRFQGTFISHAAMHPLQRKLAEYRLPAVIHLFAESTMEAPWGLEALAERHPDVTFVGLDAFTGVTHAQYATGVARRCPNVLLETAGAFPLGRLLDEFVERLGSTRLLFGTDLYLAPPMWHRPYGMYEVLDSTVLTDEDKRNIFWNNAARLFGLPAGEG
jgi:predicted TIM-barrel fold metal-dependent hydrolase